MDHSRNSSVEKMVNIGAMHDVSKEMLKIEITQTRACVSFEWGANAPRDSRCVWPDAHKSFENGEAA